MVVSREGKALFGEAEKQPSRTGLFRRKRVIPVSRFVYRNLPGIESTVGAGSGFLLLPTISVVGFDFDPLAGE
jgi:hypothetical protein